MRKKKKEREKGASMKKKIVRHPETLTKKTAATSDWLATELLLCPTASGHGREVL